MSIGDPIQITDLTKTYGQANAVDDISLDIAAGEFVSFLGPSGSGKTTTLMMIAGFVDPTAGSISVNNAPIVDLPPHKRNIGMLFQSYALFPHMTVAQNVAFPLRMRGVPKAERKRRAAEALEMVRLADFANRKPAQLSGGQKQRVALARAIVFDPPVLLLDEPLGALDAKLRTEMQIELKQIHRQVGKTIVYVTHDQHEALTMSDRIAVFRNGRISQIGTPRDLYRRPANRFVAEFLGESTIIEGTVTDVSGPDCRIGVGNASFVGARRDGFPDPQSRATFALRPECIRLMDQAAGLDNSFTGTIRESLYLGDVTRCQIDVGGETSITASIPDETFRGAITAGQQITIGWQKEDMLMIEAA